MTDQTPTNPERPSYREKETTHGVISIGLGDPGEIYISFITNEEDDDNSFFDGIITLTNIVNPADELLGIVVSMGKLMSQVPDNCDPLTEIQAAIANDLRKNGFEVESKDIDQWIKDNEET